MKVRKFNKFTRKTNKNNELILSKYFSTTSSINFSNVNFDLIFLFKSSLISSLMILGRKATSLSAANRIADFLGAEMVKDKGT